MKKKFTDLLDDLPAEELENLLRQSDRKKKRGMASGMFKVAAAVAVITVLGGGVTLAAYSNPGFLRDYLGFGEGEKEKASVVVKEEEISAENEDYILSVEEFAGDETTQMVLVRVEGKTDEGKEYLRTHATAAPVLKTAQNSTDNWIMQFAEDNTEMTVGQKEGIRYYLITLENAVGTATIYFGESLKKVDVQYDTEWFKEHESEIVKLDFEVENTVSSSSITLSPGEIEDGVAFDSIVIGHFFVSGEGTRADSKRLEMPMPIPEIAAVYEDGSVVIIMAGNMGYESQEEIERTLANGYTYETPEGKGEHIRFESTFEGYLDIEKVKEIQINGKSYPVEK